MEFDRFIEISFSRFNLLVDQFISFPEVYNDFDILLIIQCNPNRFRSEISKFVDLAIISEVRSIIIVFGLRIIRSVVVVLVLFYKNV